MTNSKYRSENSEQRGNPILLQVNTRVYLNEIGRSLNRPATLDDIPEGAVNGWSDAGFDWIYLLSVWQTGEAARQVSRTVPAWRRTFEETLHDLREEDIIGSGFAVKGYWVAEELGGPEAMDRFRKRISLHGMKLMLDFVPNHVAPDHPWVEEHPDYFIAGTEKELIAAPENYTWVKREHGEMILAYGRDPYFPGWPDTVQLDYGNPHLRAAMKEQLLHLAGLCDGVRCDMAMLLEPEVFIRTWGVAMDPFWPDAISRVKTAHPGFVLMGEVYWDMEHLMQQQGFDFTYDKRLYDRLRAGVATPVRDHLKAGLDYQEKLTRFLENHDEPRAAAVFPWDQHQAAALLAFLTPGMKFIHQGECLGFRIHLSPHLGRAPVELPDILTGRFYARLLALLKRPLFHSGDWQLLTPLPAWEGNPTHLEMIAFEWRDEESVILTVVNYSAGRSQCRLFIPCEGLEDHTWQLQDPIRDELYQRNGTELREQGLFIDLEGWGTHVFEMRKNL